MSWNDGYRTDLPYTYGYFGEMNPAVMKFLLLVTGLVPPEVSCACEPGYGQGLSINIHAAAEPVIWWGTDFHPAHALLAGEMARITGAHCLDESFQDFCSRDDLPEFDYIALHGVWSWVSPQNQHALIGLIRRRLRVGGVVYISYNTTPGWHPFRPVRDLMKLYADAHNGSGMEAGEQISHAVEFVQKFAGLKPGYFAANPGVAQRLKGLDGRDGHYLAHDLFNGEWAITSFAEMNSIMEEARMSYACPAQPLGAIYGLGMNEEQRNFIREMPNPVLRQTLLDFMYNVQFRKDFWIKGAVQLGAVARNSALREQQFILLAPMTQISRQIRTSMGEITLSEGAHAVITAVMKDGKPHACSELEKMAQQLAARETAPEDVEKEDLQTLMQAMLVLMAGGLASPSQQKADTTKARPVTEKLNFMICQRAIDSGDINFLASPVTGGGINVPRFAQLFLLAIKRGARTADVMATFARDCLNAAGQHIILDGKVINEPAETMQHLQTQAETFISSVLPVLKNLQIV